MANMKRPILALVAALGAAWLCTGPANVQAAGRVPKPPVAINSEAAGGAPVNLEIDVSDVVGHDMASEIELQGGGLKEPNYIEVPKGHLKTHVPPGNYKAYVYVYVLEVPWLVDVQDLAVKDNDRAYLAVSLLEGSGERPLMAFDQDHDFAIDRVETKCKTDPADAVSIPGREKLPFNDAVLAKKEGWYRGELHAHSQHGTGKETTGQLVRRAEKAGLDFLAIADRNTVAACKDPEYKSDSVVCIPAMEWGSDDKGVALLYGMRTFPRYVKSPSQAQALVDLVQAQGGFFCIAHPCFPTAPWQWELSYVNGVEVWCREYNGVPPLSLEKLGEDLKERIKGKLVHSIAFAAASESAANLDGLPEDMKVQAGLSANGQASVFYDAELVRGLKAAAIGGSNTSSPEVPMGAPVTYVYAIEKSARGIVNGLRRGRTFVSCGLDGPTLSFTADVLKDGVVDASLGGIVPLGVPTHFSVGVKKAKGKELQVLCNGRQFVSKTIDSDAAAVEFDDTPASYTEYRVRITGKPKQDRFGLIDVYALSSPIYAQDLDLPDKKLKDYKKSIDKKKTDNRKEVQLPASPGRGEIKPKFQY